MTIASEAQYAVNMRQLAESALYQVFFITIANYNMH